MIQKILVPTDFSECADAALKYATELARRFDAELLLFHVVAMPMLYPTGSEMATAPLFEVTAASETRALAALNTQAQQLGLPANRVAARTIVGIPVSEILDVADKEHFDLIVMGTHGRGVIDHLLLGSVAERVVRKSHVPVLTVHGPVKAKDSKPGLATTIVV